MAEQLTVKHAPFTTGWWVIEGEWNPPNTPVVARFAEFRDAAEYVRVHSPSDAGRPTAGLNNEVVSYALRTTGSVTGAAKMLGVNRSTLHRWISSRLSQNSDAGATLPAKSEGRS